MHTARAVRISGHGAPEVLTIGELAVRDPGPGELLVDVACAGLNRADLLQRRGRYPAPPGVVQDVPGLEYAGTVLQLGSEVDAFAVGDRVMGIAPGGAMATRLVVHAREAMPVPEALSMHQAAAIPEAFLTAFDALISQGRFSTGEAVLIHGVASGVGTAALQLARAGSGLVVGTSRSASKLERCRALGLERGVLAEDGKFAAAASHASGGRGFDLVLDMVGAPYLDDNLEVLALGGRMVVIGLLGGANAALPLGKLMAKRAQIIGTVLRGRPLEEKAALAQRFRRQVLPLFASGTLHPVVDTVLPMAEVVAAHHKMEQNDTVGKVVLRW